MLTKILSRGGRASGYLALRFLTGTGHPRGAPAGPAVQLGSPAVRAGLVRLAKLERSQASRYLDLPAEPGGNSFKRSLWLLWMPLLDGARAVRGGHRGDRGTGRTRRHGAVVAEPGQLQPDGSRRRQLARGTHHLARLQILVSLGLLGWGAPAVARRHAQTVRDVLAPSEAELLTQRVEELTRSRAGAVDSHGAELRRIERDLHDGTQAQLVSLAMRIGIAKQMMADDPEKAASLLDDARDGAEQAMNELRGVLRTMYPPILADRGLAGAVSALCARCPLPVDSGSASSARSRPLSRPPPTSSSPSRSPTSPSTPRPGMSTY